MQGGEESEDSQHTMKSSSKLSPDRMGKVLERRHDEVSLSPFRVVLLSSSFFPCPFATAVPRRFHLAFDAALPYRELSSTTP